MGCGSSKSTVSVIDTTASQPNEAEHEKPILKKQPSSLDHFIVHNSVKSLKSENKLSNSDSNLSKDINNNKNNDVISLRKTNSCESIKSRTSLKSLKQLDNEINNNKSILSIQKTDANSTRGISANSSKSNDSGVFDEGERIGSGKSLLSYTDSLSSKPPSASKKSSARKKLLRIADNDIENKENAKPSTLEPLNVVQRPASRFGNVAFDLMIDMPETGNAKKRPDKLPALKKRRSSKKLRTKEEIDKKLEDAQNRRKIIDGEKQLKAKQFQHLAIHTPVEPFNDDDIHETSSDINISRDQTNEVPPRRESVLGNIEDDDL